jgi:hypothetical protein
MKWVRDRTGRFERRPYYHQQEIDVQCEEVLASYWRDRGKSPAFPMSTDDLTVLIEHEASELDLYANLASEGRDVEGVTEFFPRKKPVVRIAKYLSDQPSRENRLRSTLAHELGLVVFHNFLWTLDTGQVPRKSMRRATLKCRRAKILAAPQTDWMEWQAGYASGALLMPITPMRELVAGAFSEWGVAKRVEFASDRHFDLIDRVAAMFTVSRDAAGVRLLKLGYTESQTT